MPSYHVITHKESHQEDDLSTQCDSLFQTNHAELSKGLTEEDDVSSAKGDSLLQTNNVLEPQTDLPEESTNSANEVHGYLNPQQNSTQPSPAATPTAARKAGKNPKRVLYTEVCINCFDVIEKEHLPLSGAKILKKLETTFSKEFFNKV